jgi:hypothetical protein
METPGTETTETMTTYLSNGVHPEIKYLKDCRKCQLGINRAEHNQRVLERGDDDDSRSSDQEEYCVGGAGPHDLTKVKLIVISDYPGHFEVLHNQPMYDIRESRDERRKGLLQSKNAGAILRTGLSLMYGLDTYTECWITNAIKCNPKTVTPSDNAHLKVCAFSWLSSELFILDNYVPKCPILVAGSKAFQAVKFIYKEEREFLESRGLHGCRRRKDIKLGEHPAVFTFNPAVAARSEPRIETTVKSSKGRLWVNHNDWLYPLLPGSPLQKFIDDLRMLEDFVDV